MEEILKLSDANLMVYLHPSKSNNVTDAILTELSSLLFKFNESFDGVVLAYDIVEKLSDLAKILPGIHPYFGVKLKVRMLLFYPKPDMLLDGKVVKLGRQSIHIIVLGFSSATIIEEDIRKEFRYKIKHGKEVYVSKSDKQHKIKVGTIIRFIVKSFDEEIVHISGSLLPNNTGSVRWLHSKSEDLPQPDSNTKKRRGSEGIGETMELNKVVVDGETLSLSTDRQTKKSKRRKTSDH